MRWRMMGRASAAAAVAVATLLGGGGGIPAEDGGRGARLHHDVDEGRLRHHVRKASAAPTAQHPDHRLGSPGLAVPLHPTRPQPGELNR